jgi:hypothetical protein
MEHNLITNTRCDRHDLCGLVDSAGPKLGSTGNIVRNNAYWRTPEPQYGPPRNMPTPWCSYARASCSNNINVDPRYVDRAEFNFSVTNPALSGYGLPSASQVGPQ